MISHPSDLTQNTNLEPLFYALEDRIKILRITCAQQGLCQQEFQEVMAEIMIKIFSKEKTKLILKSEHIIKSLLTYIKKKPQLQESVMFELLGEIEDKISVLSDLEQTPLRRRKQETSAPAPLMAKRQEEFNTSELKPACNISGLGLGSQRQAKKDVLVQKVKQRKVN